MTSICKTLALVMVLVVTLAVSLPAKQGYGTLTGVVLDPSGLPQMGASVWLMSEDAGGKIVLQLLSNQDGAFSTDHLKPGRYAVRDGKPSRWQGGRKRRGGTRAYICADAARMAERRARLSWLGRQRQRVGRRL